VQAVDYKIYFIDGRLENFSTSASEKRPHLKKFTFNEHLPQTIFPTVL